jgi:hypothetical protein
MFEFIENQRYLVRDLLRVSVDEMLASKEASKIILIFDDGELESSSRECIHGRVLWHMYDIYKYIKVSKHHHIGMWRRKHTPDVNDNIMNRIMWDCAAEGEVHGIVHDLDASSRQITHVAYLSDILYHHLREYAVFVSSVDFIELQHHPRISASFNALRAKANVNPADIGTVYSDINHVVDKDDDYKQNALVLASRSSSIKRPQLYKCIGPIGFIADVDSNIFPKPVLDSFCTGVTNIRDLIMESRTAAMSIFYQKHAMQQSEYLTRMLQLAAACVYRVHHNVDCGSKRYLEIPIRGTGDLKDMCGIYYLDQDTGEEKPITEKSLHLCNRVIKIRSVINCELPDRYGVCAKCYGQISHSLFDTDNIGQIAASVIQRIVTQSILSNKHLVASAKGEKVVLTGDDQAYLRPKPGDEDEFHINPNLKGKRVTISFAADNATRLQDIMFLEDISANSPVRLTQLDELLFRVYSEDTIDREYPVRVSSNSQKAFFTVDMLEYIKKHGWTIDVDGRYEINLDHWNFNENPSVIGIPMVQYSTPMHMMAVKEMLTTSTDSTKENKYSISKYPNAAAALLAFQDLIKLRLNVNFAHLQTIILTYLCANPDDFDFRIPKIKYEGTLMPYNDVMVTRDIALAMSYQKQYDTLRSMRTYVIDQRHTHVHSNALRG